MAMIEKIISGGQIGADIAALRAGYNLGITTGGWMPHGWRTLNGPMPQYSAAYGMQEHECTGYPPRTRQNVYESDGTVRFAQDFSTPGEVCTMNAIREFDKPFFDILIGTSGGRIPTMTEITFRTWLIEQNVAILNVAGNARGEIESPVEAFLIRAITRHNAQEARRLAAEASPDTEAISEAEDPSGYISSNTVRVRLSDISANLDQVLRNLVEDDDTPEEPPF